MLCDIDGFFMLFVPCSAFSCLPLQELVTYPLSDSAFSFLINADCSGLVNEVERGMGNG